MFFEVMRDAVTIGFAAVFLQSVAGSVSPDIWWLIERFGLPTIFLLILWAHSARKETRYHRETRADWAENNKYLRQLVSETKAASYCRYKDYGNEKTSIQ
jgi:hypothetical protein